MFLFIFNVFFSEKEDSNLAFDKTDPLTETTLPTSPEKWGFPSKKKKLTCSGLFLQFVASHNLCQDSRLFLKSQSRTCDMIVLMALVSTSLVLRYGLSQATTPSYCWLIRPASWHHRQTENTNKKRNRKKWPNLKVTRKFSILGNGPKVFAKVVEEWCTKCVRHQNG